MSELMQNGFHYIVLPGDTLYKISQQFDVPLRELIRVNNIAEPYTIYPGQEILIPKATPPEPPAGTKIYTVKKGDTLFSIAQTFNVTVDDIVKLNNLTNPELIYPGQKLLIPSSK
ncbi:MAG: LysM peptidoglycan-binding domain-containing protein [Clostridiales bacterium]|nr:LysM peptidoglycan-binding domain-containing protein [Clostridiales bacterium]